jgi:hypothetical protein
MGGFHMKKRKLPDQDMISIFSKAKRIQAPESTLGKLRKRITAERLGTKREVIDRSLSLAQGRRLVIAVVLTLIIAVPLTFFTTKRIFGTETTQNSYVVRFVFENRDAQSVQIVGDFNAWNDEQTEMTRVPNTNLWTAEVVLAEGLYRYGFLIDDTQWAADPIAKIKVKDDFGKESSLIMLIDEPDDRINL